MDFLLAGRLSNYTDPKVQEDKPLSAGLTLTVNPGTSFIYTELYSVNKNSQVINNILDSK